MKGVAFVSVAFGDQRYLDQLARLKESILKIYPDATIFAWQDEMPPGAKSHSQSLYGFKVHAVDYAIKQGFEKVIWIDPAMILQDKVDYYFGFTMSPVIAVKDDNLLNITIGIKALEYYGNPEIIDKHLVGGSLYVFDFKYPVAHDVFKHWYVSEQDGIFGSQKEAASEQINMHRYDESCMAIALMANNIAPVGHDVARYCQGPGSIWIKKHFK